MFDEYGKVIEYSARELYVDQYMAMYVNTGEYGGRTKMLYNGGTVINRKVTELAFSLVDPGGKRIENADVLFTLFCNGVEYYVNTQPERDEYGRYVYRRLPAHVDGKDAVYTVKVRSFPGYLVSYVNRGEHAGEKDSVFNDGTAVGRKVPHTGYSIRGWMIALFGSLTGMGFLTIRKKNTFA